MKKKLVAILLSALSVISMVMEAGAAAFDDQQGAVCMAEIFSDQCGGLSGELVPLKTEEIPAGETDKRLDASSGENEVPVQDPSPGKNEAPAQDPSLGEGEAPVQDPSPEGNEASGQAPSPTDPQVEIFGDSEDDSADGLFSSGEDPAETPVGDVFDLPFDEAEFLASQVVLKPGDVLMFYWQQENGKWKLVKSVEEKPQTDGQPEEGDAGGRNSAGETSAPEEGTEGSPEQAGQASLQENFNGGDFSQVEQIGEGFPQGEQTGQSFLQEGSVGQDSLQGNFTEREEGAGEAQEPEVPGEDTATGEEEPLKTASVTSYYTAEDGIVHIRTLQSAVEQKVVTEGDYLFDEEGYLITGRTQVEAGTPGFAYEVSQELFFMDELNAELNPDLIDMNANVACTPFYSNLGQMQKSYWLWTGSAFRFYSSKGGFLSVAELREINRNKGTYKGYDKINGKIYCLKDDGVPREGFWDITDVKKPGSYYFLTREESNGEIPGAMLRGGWRTRKVDGQTQWRYYTKSGRHRTTGVIAKKLDTAVMGDFLYLLDGEGNILKNTMAQATGNKAWYLSNGDGQVYRNTLVKYNGVRYYFGSTGKRAAWTNSWHRIESSSNRYYYFGSNPGQVEEKKDWQLVKTPRGKVVGWFYFSSTGEHFQNVFTDTGRYFEASGKLAGGLKNVKGKNYFFQSSTTAEPKGLMYRDTWIHSRNNWYYAGSSGVLYNKGWNYIGSSWYYFQSDCSVLTNSTAVKDGVKGYVDSRGKFCTGWVVVSNANNLVKYVDPATGTFAVNRSVVVDGLTYWFDSNGYRMNDVTSKVPGPYYLEVDRVNGVMTVFNAARTIPVKSIRVSVGLPGTSTPTGRYTLTPEGRWQALMGPSWGQYATHVNGAGYGGIYVHSVACTYANSYNLPVGEYYKLGSPASHGCIRCCVGDAKWVYDHCNGAGIYIFDGTYKADEVFKGPLGRRPITPLRGSKNFDPTDPAVP